MKCLGILGAVFPGKVPGGGYRRFSALILDPFYRGPPPRLASLLGVFITWLFGFLGKGRFELTQPI
jgi:hypothetical protein